VSDTADRTRTSRANREPHQSLPDFRNGRRNLSMSANGRGKMIFAARHPATDIREAPRDGPCLPAFLSAHLSRYKQFDICMPISFAPTSTKDLGPLRP
jgi:hypothetical protein